MNASEVAKKLLDAAKADGWTVEVRGSILTITKRISGMDEFVQADMGYWSILEILPMTSPGSVWGTDGGSIGGMSALNSGLFKMNKSGGSRRVLNALKKLI